MGSGPCTADRACFAQSTHKKHTRGRAALWLSERQDQTRGVGRKKGFWFPLEERSEPPKEDGNWIHQVRGGQLDNLHLLTVSFCYPPGVLDDYKVNKDEHGQSAFSDSFSFPSYIAFHSPVHLPAPRQPPSFVSCSTFSTLLSRLSLDCTLPPTSLIQAEYLLSTFSVPSDNNHRGNPPRQVHPTLIHLVCHVPYTRAFQPQSKLHRSVPSPGFERC